MIMKRIETSLAAATMAEAGPERWDIFIGLLSGRGASNLLDALARARPLIEHHRREPILEYAR